MIKRTNKPILKWPGGKEKELPNISLALPKKIKNYYEPFVGGGAVYVNIEAENYYINDKASELATLYKVVKNELKRKEFLNYLKKIDNSWKEVGSFVNNKDKELRTLYKRYKASLDKSLLKKTVSDFISKNSNFLVKAFPKPFDIDSQELIKELEKNLSRKLTRMQAIESKKGLLPQEDVIKNIESAFKSAYYMQMRHFLNSIDRHKFTDIEKTVVFFFIRNYTYSGMFRYNKDGQFNVPYGGIGYNNNSFEKKILNFKSKTLIEKLHKTTIGDMDFYDFMKKYPPKKNDFVFLDPPYDTDFSTYNQNEFAKKDQERLANYLIKDCEANWMIVIKNTDFIYNLYNKKGLFISTFDKTYQVSFMNRNNRDTEHLLITNYKI